MFEEDNSANYVAGQWGGGEWTSAPSAGGLEVRDNVSYHIPPRREDALPGVESRNENVIGAGSVWMLGDGRPVTPQSGSLKPRGLIPVPTQASPLLGRPDYRLNIHLNEPGYHVNPDAQGEFIRLYGQPSTTDSLGLSRNAFVNSYEKYRMPEQSGEGTLSRQVGLVAAGPGATNDTLAVRLSAKTEPDAARETKPFIHSYELANAERDWDSVRDRQGDAPKSVSPYEGPGSGANPGVGNPASPVPPSAKAEEPQQARQAHGQADDRLKMRPELGESVKQYESGKEGVATVSSGKVAGGQPDPGGVSYGSYQLSSISNGKVGGTVVEFLNSPEGSKFAPHFSGLTPGSAEFSKKWKELAAANPAGLHQAEKTFIYRSRYLPVAKIAASKGFDMTNPAIQDAVWSGSLQHGRFRKVLEGASAGDPSLKFRSADDQLKQLYWARGQYAEKYIPHKNSWGRYFGYEQNQPGEVEVLRAYNKRVNERH